MRWHHGMMGESREAMYELILFQLIEFSLDTCWVVG